MDPSEALTYQEISDLNNRKLEIKRQHSEYVENHPEIKEMGVTWTMETGARGMRGKESIGGALRGWEEMGGDDAR